jgi:hypothetical protein
VAQSEDPEFKPSNAKKKKSTHLTRYLYMEYVNNSYKISKRQTNRNMNRTLEKRVSYRRNSSLDESMKYSQPGAGGSHL